jgi:hypothetical protein
MSAGRTAADLESPARRDGATALQVAGVQHPEPDTLADDLP